MKSLRLLPYALWLALSVAFFDFFGAYKRAGKLWRTLVNRYDDCCRLECWSHRLVRWLLVLLTTIRLNLWACIFETCGANKRVERAMLKLAKRQKAYYQRPNHWQASTYCRLAKFCRTNIKTVQGLDRASHYNIEALRVNRALGAKESISLKCRLLQQRGDILMQYERSRLKVALGFYELALKLADEVMPPPMAPDELQLLIEALASLYARMEREDDAEAMSKRAEKLREARAGANSYRYGGA